MDPTDQEAAPRVRPLSKPVGERLRELVGLLNAPDGPQQIVELYRARVLCAGQPIPQGHLVEDMIHEIVDAENRQS